MFSLLKVYTLLLTNKIIRIRKGVTYTYNGIPVSMIKGEYHIKKLFINLIQRLKSSGRRILFIDVGAYLGEYTMILAPYVCLAIAVEAHPENFDKLRQRLLKAKIDNVIALNYAVAKFNGETALYIREPTTHSLVRKDRARGFIKVRSLTLGSLISSFIWLGNFYLVLKIDIEGAELDAVASLTRNLVKSSLIILVVEVHGVLNKLLLPLLAWLKGFNINFIDEGHFILISKWR